ncbi:glutaredoxin family protein [Calidithermus timidus]|uniref:glutaredoxin family protein n=1 Tax=Calidithermus timidus TaxID=307124 RepID=UPI000379FD15|nr:glutaredoxin family protein [Calidithermus timidus]
MSYILISRDGCHLCEEAEQLLEALRVPFERRSVDEKPEWVAHYSFRVPVLLKGEQVLMEGRFEAARLTKLLRE